MTSLQTMSHSQDIRAKLQTCGWVGSNDDHRRTWGNSWGKSNLDQTHRVGAFKEDKKCVTQIRKYLKVKVIQ